MLRTLRRTFSSQVTWMGRNRPPKWVIGIAIGTPLAAVVQGSLLLYQFRKDHGDAPIPITPSQGLVVVASDSTETRMKSSKSVSPLRLLVVGDSLAAGVGISLSGTPVLPESIARHLSQASGGRPIHWTCIGTPGASSTQIIHDLTSYDETDREPSILEQKFVEWQAASQRAQTWFQEKQRRLQEQEKEEKVQNRVRQWWQRVRSDAKELQEVIRRKDKEQERKILAKRRLTQRKTLLDPSMMARYDIAVVMTGLNDIKDAFLPFMMTGKDASATKEARAENSLTDESSDFDGQFSRIIRALQKKMKLNLPEDKDATPDAETSEATAVAPSDQPKTRLSGGPMVVFPAMILSPLPILHHAPLSWFLVPLIRRMDNNKKLLAERYRGLVLYVEPPSISDMRAFEAGQGEIHATQRDEKILLRLTDVTQLAQEKAKALMRKYYEEKEARAPRRSEDEDTQKCDAFEQSCHDHHIDFNKKPGSTLVAADNVHPNDAGYDFWGRHIARSIVNEWKKRSGDRPSGQMV